MAPRETDILESPQANGAMLGYVGFFISLEIFDEEYKNFVILFL